MRNNPIQQPAYNDISYWKELIDKYYEGATSGEEEKALRQFLLTQESNGEFDKDIATMVYTGTGKIIYTPPKKNVPKIPLRYIVRSAVAAVLAGITIGYFTLQNTKDEYIVYIHGESYTQSEIVIKEMKNSIAGFQNTGISVEEELSDIFKQPANE